MSRRNYRAGRRKALGLSLIELMIAILIGLLVSAAAVSMFISNRQVYRAAESLGRIQENLRVSFELMAHDVREAGGNPCDASTGSDAPPFYNLVTDFASNWWSNLGAGGGVVSYNDGALGGTHAGSDAIEVLYSEDSGARSLDTQASPSAAIALNAAAANLQNGQLVLACDFRQSALFAASLSGTSLTAPTGLLSTFRKNTIIADLKAQRWYVADNNNGGRSLFRRQLVISGGVPGVGAAEEIIDGVDNMQLQYLVGNAWVDGAANLSGARAVQVTLDLEGNEANVGTDGQPLRRTLTHTIALRSRAR